MKPSLAIAAVAVLASACALDEGDVAGDTLLVPDDVELHWDASFNDVDDGLGAVIPVDVMVYDGRTGEPRSGVPVELRAPADSYVLTEGELTAVDPDDCVGCTLFWDAWRDQYYTVDVDLDDAVVTRVRTGDDGLARVHLLVDALDDGPDGFQAAPVLVVTDATDARFLLVPRS